MNLSDGRFMVVPPPPEACEQSWVGIGTDLDDRLCGLVVCVNRTALDVPLSCQQLRALALAILERTGGGGFW